ncbi:MAG: energy transducer TonB, partial [Salinisphaera sp.]|nr:energy transducer TonB [Salinisphaera sp.]
AAPLRTPVQTVTPQVTTPQTATSVQPPQAAAPVEQALPSFPQSSAAGVPVAPASAQAIAPQVIKALSVGATTQATILPPAAHTAMQPATMQARTPSGPSGATTSPDSSYIGQLRSWLGRHKQYPPKARQQGLQGTVRLYFVVDRQGRVLESRILQGSGHPALDQAALRMLKQAAPLPAMPDSLLRNRLELILPVQFHLTKPPAASAQNKPQ